jgi:hypothetical protein
MRIPHAIDEIDEVILHTAEPNINLIDPILPIGKN